MWLWFFYKQFKKRILVNAISLHSKEVISVKSVNDQMEPAETRLGFGTHADVSCAGSDGEILEIIEGKTSIVQPFNDSYNSIKGVKTVNVAFTHDTQDQGTYILIMK